MKYECPSYLNIRISKPGFKSNLIFPRTFFIVELVFFLNQYVLTLYKQKKSENSDNPLDTHNTITYVRSTIIYYNGENDKCTPRVLHGQIFFLLFSESLYPHTIFGVSLNECLEQERSSRSHLKVPTEAQYMPKNPRGRSSFSSYIEIPKDSSEVCIFEIYRVSK